MATLNFIISKTAKKSFITARLQHGRAIDVKRKTHYQIETRFWDKNRAKVRNTIECENHSEINLYIDDVRAFIIKNFDQDFLAGKTIDGKWLERVIRRFNNREQDEKLEGGDPKYFFNYAQTFLDEKKEQALVSSSIKNYESTIENVKKYGGNDLLLSQITKDFCKGFKNYLKHDLKWSTNTISGCVSRLKSILSAAGNENLEIDRSAFSLLSRNVEKVPFVILSIDDLNHLFSMKFEDKKLETARQWLIIGCWIGQRIGDVLKLTKENIINNRIELKQQKTGRDLQLPIHYMVQSILDKNGGHFPAKIRDVDLNRWIKLVCKEAGFNELTEGTKANSITRRKEAGIFERWELVTSHCMRRSFATNHFDKGMQIQKIMSVTGHVTEGEFLKYIQRRPNMFTEDFEKAWLNW